ncbi:MAG: 50S ribosomal protein L3 [Deltaproteobacteria bacterium CG11_big_fil_rev_8_21_14_0_20_47_16]|nr:MAG: 50S ribosomal protein L3 [Deltaproteobacteria bacterium CG11_big_fil_rev_8_21_14_0_20_47_16]
MALLAKKQGMTQHYKEDGTAIPVTVLLAGPCAVVQLKTKETDGYEAIQIGFGETKAKRITKARAAHCAKAKAPLYKHLREFKPATLEGVELGQMLTVEQFAKGDKVHVQGRVKGRGTQGVIKRCGKAGGPAAHGSHFHRSTGSIGMRTWPGRVLKNTGMPGHMGDVVRTIKKLEVIAVDASKNLLFVKGAVPGGKNALLFVSK